MKLPTMWMKSVSAAALYLLCAGVVYLQVFKLHRQYEEYNTRVTLQEIPNQDLEFPSVTTCVDFWTNKTRLCEMHPKNCTKKAMTIGLYAFFQQSIQPVLRNQSAFRPEKLYRCRFFSSNPECSVIINCAPFIQLSTFRRPMQMCYTLDLTKSGVSLPCGDTASYESGVSPITENVQIDLRQGFRYEIAMKQQVVKSLKAPYKSDCVDYKAMGYQEIYSGIHSQESCIQECCVEAELKQCGCVSFGHEFIANMKHDICIDIKRGVEYCRDLVFKSPAFTDCFKRCRIPCEKKGYDLRLVRMSLMKDVEPENRETAFKMFLKFGTNRVEHLEYHPIISFAKVLAHLGGSIGICIGVSSVQLLNWIVDVSLKAVQRLRNYFTVPK